MACPSEDSLLAFVEGTAAADEHDRIVEHISHCDVCLTAVGSSDDQRSDSDPGEARIPSGVGFRAKDVIAARYEIQRFIARGGMGEVYDAEDRLLGGRVALKTVLLEAEDDPRSLALMRGEVKAARAINHPAVCRVFDLGEHPPPGTVDPAGRRFFLTMEFLEGQTLGKQIRTQGALEPACLLAVARQLAAGLAAAHAAGVIHRDFKSDNVMLVPTPHEPPMAKIMDFGLARHGAKVSSRASFRGAMVGSAAYMAPEQVQGHDVKESADIYAFGVVLFEAATGRLPFVVQDSVVATAIKRLFEDPPNPRSLAPTLDLRIEALILRCLRRAPAERFTSMEEIRALLDRIAEDRVPTEPVPLLVPERRPVARRALWLGTGAAAILVAASFVMLRPPRPSDPPLIGGRPSVVVVPAPVNPPAPPLPRQPEDPPPQDLTAVVTPVPPAPSDNAPRTARATRTKRPASPTKRPAATLRPPGASATRNDSPPSPDSDSGAPPRSESPLDGFHDPFAQPASPR
jgi:serine/threonine protein kinase